jgi:hypothetical protein
MALRKRIDKRREPLTPTQWEFLCDVETTPDNFERWVLDADCSPFFKVKDLWEANRAEILANTLLTIQAAGRAFGGHTTRGGT